jgi:hypothetical protein
MAEGDGPFIVVCEEVATGATTYVGPFDVLEDALRAAEVSEADGRAHPGEDVRCTVVPLSPDVRLT